MEVQKIHPYVHICIQTSHPCILFTRIARTKGKLDICFQKAVRRQNSGNRLVILTPAMQFPTYWRFGYLQGRADADAMPSTILPFINPPSMSPEVSHSPSSSRCLSFQPPPPQAYPQKDPSARAAACRVSTHAWVWGLAGGGQDGHPSGLVQSWGSGDGNLTDRNM